MRRQRAGKDAAEFSRVREQSVRFRDRASHKRTFAVDRTPLKPRNILIKIGIQRCRIGRPLASY